jgi:hypothetical protein
MSPTSILFYIRLVLCTAWGHSASLARNTIFYAVVIVGAAIFLAPILGMTIEAAGLLSLLRNPTFYAGLFGAIILSRLFCAPYWIWREQQVKIATVMRAERQQAELKSEQKVDVTAWDRVSVFTIRQAAQLWSGNRPTSSGQLSQLAEVVQRELIEAGNQNKIIIETPPPMSDLQRMLLQLGVLATGRPLSKTFVDSEVTRENLRTYALSKNERPSFLFPEDR